MHPPFSFRSCPKRKRAVHGPKEKGAWTRSGAVALRARGAADRCLRRFGPAFGHAILFCDSCDCRPVAGVPTLSERLSHGPATLFAAAGRWLMRVSVWGNATAPTIARAARSEAERAERGTGQMRFCTPAQDAPPPRESTAKCTPHPAAPVDMSPQTRRHRLAPTPVQQLCTHVQSCDQKRSFLLDRARPVFFSILWKRKWGCICPAISMAVIPRSMGRTLRTGPRRACFAINPSIGGINRAI